MSDPAWRLYFAFLMSIAALAATVPARAEDTEGWDAGITAGYTLNSGNTENSLLNAAAKAEHQAGHHITRFGVEGSYGETDVEETDGTTRTEKTAENVKGFSNYKRTFGRAFGYVDGSILHDDIAEVDYRGVIGPGLGYFVVQNDKASLSIETGPSYVWEEVAGVEDDYLAVRFAERGEWKVSETAKVWEQVEYLPRADDFDDYLLTAEVGIEAAMNSSLSLSVVARDKYDSTPGAGLEENDLTVIAGLTYKLW